MKKKYEIPEAEAIQMTLEWGLLQVQVSDDPIHWGNSSPEPDVTE